MKLIFNKMELCNFMSFRDATVDFTEGGYVLVVGSNKYSLDNAYSNGSGKSSLWEAITWCLTGQTIRGSKNIINYHAEDGCYVSLDFNVDETNYLVIRSKDHSQYKTNLKIFVNDVDKSGKGIRDSEKLLSMYLPDITASLIGSVVILGQGLPMRFTSNTPSGRKEILEKLAKSDFMIEDLKLRISNRKNTLDGLIKDKSNDVIRKTTELQMIYKSIDQITEKLNNLQDIQVCKELISATELMIQQKENDLEVSNIEYNDQVNTQALLTQERSNFDIKFRDTLQELYDEYTENTKDINTRINELTIQRNILIQEISQLNSIIDVCPTCGQRIPDVHKVDTTDKEIEKKNIEEELLELNSRLKEINTEFQLKEVDIKDAHKSEDSKFSVEIDLCSKRVSELATSIQNFNKELSNFKIAMSNYERSVEEYNNRKEELEKELNISNDNIVRLDKEILYISSDRDTLQKHLEVVNKFNTIVTRDFRGVLLQNVIQYINSKVKSYARCIFENDDIEFTLDGNNISITYLGKEYESLSGGEKQKIDVIIQFAMRDMLSKFMNFSSNILVLDEITDNLDNLGCQKILQLISTKLTDVESVYIISHRKDLDIPVDRYLKVEKTTTGVSQIV